jgi:hypothetical protein
MSEGQAKIDNRQRLARSLGVSDNTLRSRVHRVRHRLERCVQACVAAAEGRGPDAASVTNRAFPTPAGEDD